MKVTINSDQLDISDWKGKKQRIQTAIEKEIHRRNELGNLPYRLIMTMGQYELLKNTREFGDKGEWRYYEPQDRIYYSPYNAMEIEIKA